MNNAELIKKYANILDRIPAKDRQRALRAMAEAEQEYIDKSIKQVYGGRSYERLTEAEKGEVGRVLARHDMAQPAPQRKTLMESAQQHYEPTEPFLSEPLAAPHWKALSDRRIPWPHAAVGPKDALRQLAPLMTYSLLDQQASARGRRVSDLIPLDQEI